MNAHPDGYIAVSFDRCDHIEGPFFHGTKVAFEVGDQIVPGHGSNYHDGRTSNNLRRNSSGTPRRIRLP